MNSFFDFRHVYKSFRKRLRTVYGSFTDGLQVVYERFTTVYKRWKRAHLRECCAATHRARREKVKRSLTRWTREEGMVSV